MPARRHSLIPGLIAAALSLLGAACATTSIKHEGRPAGAISLPLNGVYKATIIPPFDFIGPISGRISAQPTPTGFVASTRPGVAWDMIGGVQGFLGSLFVPFIFPGGTIGTWTSGIPDGDKPGEGWFGVGGIKSAGVRTRLVSPDRPLELVLSDGRRVGLLKLEPDTPNSPPAYDYPALADNIETGFKDRLYDADLLKTSAISAYIRQVKSNSRIARDDVEFIFGTVAAGRNYIKFTMPLVFTKGNPVSRAAMTDWSASELTPIRAAYDEKTGLATIRVDAFLLAGDVDRVFRQVLSWKPRGLILDFRTAPGITLASLRSLSWIIQEPWDAGVWFGPRQRKDVLAGNLDTVPVADLASAASVEEIESILDTKGAVHVTIRPESAAYNGPVAVITSKRTSASVEPVVWLLKNHKRATSYGQITAGKPLLSRPIDIGQQWILWLAAADYRTPTGDRLNERGTRPDFEFNNREAAQAAAEKWLLGEAAADPAPEAEPKKGSTSTLLAPLLKAAGLSGDKH